MSDSDIFSLNSSVFTKTINRTIVTGPITQRTCNFQTRQGEQIILQLASIIPVNHPYLLDNSGNTSRLLAPIFLANTSQKSIENAPTPTCASWESVHRAMGIDNNDNSDSQLSDLDDDIESNFIYHNSEDEARFNPEAGADNEENKNKIESKSHSNHKVELIVGQPAGWRQIRSDIYT